MKRISLIVPCLNEEEAIPAFKQEIDRVFKECLEGYAPELIFVDDGSTDRSLEMIKKMAEHSPEVKFISFSRNFAKEPMTWAVAEGLISGVAVGREALLDPQGAATREQFAMMMAEYMMQVLPLTPDEPDEPDAPDVPSAPSAPVEPSASPEEPSASPEEPSASPAPSAQPAETVKPETVKTPAEGETP